MILTKLCSKARYFSSITIDGNHIPDVSDLAQMMNQQDERQESEQGIADAMANSIADNIAEQTEACQTDDECGYPLYSCYEIKKLTEDVAVKQCFITWWFILILVLICLVVLICIIACIVVCFCRACC